MCRGSKTCLFSRREGCYEPGEPISVLVTEIKYLLDLLLIGPELTHPIYAFTRRV